MPGRPGSLDASAIPGLIAPEHRDEVAWLYPSSLLNRRPPSRAPPSGARATSDLPRQPESGSAHCFVTVRPLLAWPYHQRINERCRNLRRKSLCPAPSPRRARRQRATIAILVEENAYFGCEQTVIWIHPPRIAKAAGFAIKIGYDPAG